MAPCAATNLRDSVGNPSVQGDAPRHEEVPRVACGEGPNLHGKEQVPKRGGAAWWYSSPRWEAL
ncbi:MAG: hypothetical protein AMXMBFR64_55790 [Myxococcales bacterium]